MKTRCSIKTLFFLAVILALPLTAMAADSSAQNDNATMVLGKIEVHGEKNIVKTLQAIKVGLQMPYSNDPKLANVVVCRLVDQAGSHIKQWLICGTNRTLSQQRAAVHIAMDAAVTAGSQFGSSCMSAGCYEQVFAVLNETLNSLPGNYLHTSVNGAALHGLLEKIPYPTPAPPATSAPAAATHQ